MEQHIYLADTTILRYEFTKPNWEIENCLLVYVYMYHYWFRFINLTGYTNNQMLRNFINEEDQWYGYMNVKIKKKMDWWKYNCINGGRYYIDSR